MTDKKPSCFICGLNPWLVKAALLFGLAGPVLGGVGIYAGTRDEGPKTTKAIVTVLTPQGMWVTFTPTPTGTPIPAPTEPLTAREPVIREIVREIVQPPVVVSGPPVVVTVVVPVARVGLTPVATGAAVPEPSATPVCVAPPGWQKNGRCP